MNENTINTVTPERAKQLLNDAGSKGVLLDVRTPAEFSSVHAENAINLPLQSISPATTESWRGYTVICICQKGGRGAQAASILAHNGFSGVCNVQGGTEAWEQLGLPVIRGKSSVSLSGK